MKSETKAKFQCTLRKIGNELKPWVIPMLIVSTISAAWSGCISGARNEQRLNKELEEIGDWRKRYTDLGLANADMVCELNERVEKLEEENQKLLEEAMDITEGKESV